MKGLSQEVICLNKTAKVRSWEVTRSLQHTINLDMQTTHASVLAEMYWVQNPEVQTTPCNFASKGVSNVSNLHAV